MECPARRTAPERPAVPAGRFRRVPLAASGVLLAAVLLAGSAPSAWAGHEVTFYPSYYPQAITIDSLEPGAAIAELGNKTLHAYLGEVPDEASLPGHVKSLESLDSFVVLEANPASPVLASHEGRCAALRGIVGDLRGEGSGFVFHPYAVTPFHADYLHHLDLIEDAEASLETETATGPDLKVRARGPRAEALVRGRWEPASESWDVSLEEVPVADLLGALGGPLNGWSGSPWAKEGWFQAYELLAPPLAGTDAGRSAGSLRERLLAGAYQGLAEQVDLERRLVAALSGGCRRLVAGYTVRRDLYSDDYTAGIENLAYDSQMGLDSPVFVRTVKLKDYPWNGEVRLAVNGRAEAAWNPVAGFTDAAGRLSWSVAADPALVPLPYNASWIPNRLNFTLERVQGQSGGIRLPAEAVLPEPGTGALQPVAAGSFGSAKLVYELFASPFRDGTETEVPDLLYPFVHAYRWGVEAGAGDRAYDPYVAAATAQLRERLVGIRVVRVEHATNEIAPGVQVAQSTPVIEIYLANTPGDEQQVAALAPPWSTVPWHLMVLMEEAVLRGHAAFSKAEADRLGVPWLDLVRDEVLHERLRALIGEFETAGYRPVALESLVTEEAARARWRALREFAQANRHLLVTNGPYRLKSWRPGSAEFEVVRDMTYPLGFGTFDGYVHPLRAVVREVSRESRRVTVRVEVEKTVKVQRHYETSLVPLNRQTARGVYGALVVSRYLLIGPDGGVVRADKMHWEGDERFTVELPEDMSPGRYTILVAVYLDGNTLRPSTGTLRFEAQG